MAAPHVAGVAALLLAADPTATPATITSRLLANATPSVVTGAGTGSPNLLLASQTSAPTPITLPTAPRNLVATPANTRVTLSFDVPADAGGAAITDYVIEQSTAGGAWTTVADGVSGLASAEITGLVNGTAYAFRVAAVNSAGTSPFSSPVTATPALGLSNDDFQDASTVAGDAGTRSGSTAYATRQLGEPAHGGTGGSASIWYRWTAPANGTLTVTTGSGATTVENVSANGAGNAVTIDATLLSIAADHERSVGQLFISWNNPDELVQIAESALVVLQDQSQDYFPQFGNQPAHVTILDDIRIQPVPPPITDRFGSVLQIGVALFLGFVLAFTLEITDRTLRRPDQIAQLGLDILAYIPRE